MRFDTGPVCIVDQTAPKTTPRPTPRDASRMRDVRTQLAPAVARGGRPAAGVARYGRRDGVVSVVFRVRVLRYRGPSISDRLCVRAASAPQMSSKCKLWH